MKRKFDTPGQIKQETKLPFQGLIPKKKAIKQPLNHTFKKSQLVGGIITIQEKLFYKGRMITRTKYIVRIIQNNGLLNYNYKVIG